LHFGTRSAITKARLNEKEEANMNTTLSRKTAYIGAGAGLVLFIIFGLLPGSLLGGAAGIKLAGVFFGLPLEPGIIARAIVLLAMLVGVMVSGITIITATSTVGWLAGKVLEGRHVEEKSTHAA
jgi:pheromone shutdown protein TraB